MQLTHKMILQVYGIFCFNLILIGATTGGAFKGTLVDWSMRMHLQGVQDLSAYLGNKKSATIIRQGTTDDFESLSLILPSDCIHSNCTEAMNSCTLTSQDNEVKRLVIRSNAQRQWVVECAIFSLVDIPEEEGGPPARRTVSNVGRDRPSRLPTTNTNKTSPAAAGNPVSSPSGPGKYEVNTPNVTREEKSIEYCNKLEKEDISEFYQKCCLLNRARDSRCALTTLLAAYNEQHKQEVEVPTVKPNRTGNPFEEVSSDGEDDVSNLAKSLDQDYDEGSNKTDESVSKETDQETVENTTNWKGKYFTVLGFFLAFLAIFLIVIIALIYKIRKSKDAATAPVSPGAGLSVSRSRQGYSSVAEEEEEDRAPLTPATQQAQAFQY